MSDSISPQVIAIVGPTAAGKTDLAERLALEMDGEIVSADSMQVYRGMDIGTAKPPEPRRVPYHVIDVVDPGEEYSAARFQEDARASIAAIAARGGTPIVAGGTGLYVRAALDDWDIPSGQVGGSVRRELERLLAEEGSEALYGRLVALDPDSALLIHRNNSRRVIRALEMLEHGVSYADQAAHFDIRRSLFDTRFIGLTLDRDALYDHIDARVERMVAEGLLDEVRTLLAKGFRDAVTAAQAIGYKEFVPVIEGDTQLEAAMAEIQQATRRYAKRQLTWFRADPRIEWIDVTEKDAESVLVSARDLLSSDGPVDPGARE